jgi:hypothetical protein
MVTWLSSSSQLLLGESKFILQNSAWNQDRVEICHDRVASDNTILHLNGTVGVVVSSILDLTTPILDHSWSITFRIMLDLAAS